MSEECKDIAYVGEPGPEPVHIPKGVKIIPIGDMGKVPEEEAQDGMASLVSVIHAIVSEEVEKMKKSLLAEVVKQVRAQAGRHEW